MKGVARLKRALDAAERRYGREYLESDPIAMPHRYARADDREVAAFLAAALAFGGATQIRRSVVRVLDAMGPRPARWVRGFRAEREGAALEGFTHRFVRGRDLGCMFLILKRMLREDGSIEGFFAHGHAVDAPTVRDGLASFSARALETDLSPYYKGALPSGARVRFLFVSPESGSACKRMNLFLRWVAREADGVDLGLWKAVSPRQLIIPLDTHVARVSRRLGLTRRNTPDWRMAEEVTAALRALDPSDPCRYDFALCRPGILGLCREEGARCGECPLGKVCGPE